MSLIRIALFFLVFFSSAVSASTTSKIESILLYEAGNIVYVYPVGGVKNAPSCHGSNGDYMSFKMDRPMSKEYLSLLMLAFAAEKTVTLFSHGVCVDQSISETLSYLLVTK
jgi:hypothetical protein